MMTHEAMMQRCLELALKGRGRTHPNPMVGCIVLDAEGNVVGEGYHTAYGQPHAEPMALAQAGEKARGGTLYVSLEPCNHTGKTPPCSEAVLAAGIKTVYCGLQDPNPKVDGSGIETLRRQGIQVTSGVLEAECAKLNEAFLHFIRYQQPFVVMKQAMTLDGKIATRNGESQWITSPEARRHVHQLRADSDAILTTAESVMADNSRLTVRDADVAGNPPMRVILDSRMRCNPETLSIFEADPAGGPVWIFTRPGQSRSPNAVKAREHGAMVTEVAYTGQGLDLQAVMSHLGEKRVTQVMVEAGGRLVGSLLQAGLVHKCWFHLGGMMLGDPAARPVMAGDPLWSLAEATRFDLTQTMLAGNTLVVEAYPLLPEKGNFS